MGVLDDPSHYLDAAECPSCGEEIVFDVRWPANSDGCEHCGWAPDPEPDFDDTRGDEWDAPIPADWEP